MCDVRIASTNARFACSFIKLGLIPGDGGAWLLPRIVGGPRAAELAFTGRAIDASQALDYGLVSQVVEPGALLPTALALAQEIAAHPASATRRFHSRSTSTVSREALSAEPALRKRGSRFASSQPRSSVRSASASAE